MASRTLGISERQIYNHQSHLKTPCMGTMSYLDTHPQIMLLLNSKWINFAKMEGVWTDIFDCSTSCSLPFVKCPLF